MARTPNFYIGPEFSMPYEQMNMMEFVAYQRKSGHWYIKKNRVDGAVGIHTPEVFPVYIRKLLDNDVKV